MAAVAISRSLTARAPGTRAMLPGRQARPGYTATGRRAPPDEAVYFRMISARMSRAARAFLVVAASIAVALVATACGTEKVKVAKSQGSVYTGAVLFNQRCSGCHTLSYAATHGSAAKVTTAQYNNGPNFDVRCERPVSRVLYAIENGGFSGAIMPQNVVVGHDAPDVAEFVAKYAGLKAPKQPGSPVCAAQPIGAIPPPLASTASAAAAAGSSSASGAVVARGATGKSGGGGATGPSGPSGPTGAKGAKAKAGAKAKKNKKP